MNITDSQQFDITITATDRKGQPVQVDGVLSFVSSNPAVATVTPSEDGKSATVAGVIPGDATISVTDTLNATGEQIGGSLDVHVTTGAATVVQVVAGPVSEQPTA